MRLKEQEKGTPRILVKKDLKIKALGLANLDPNQNPLEQIKKTVWNFQDKAEGTPVVQWDMGSIPSPGRSHVPQSN